MNILMFGPNGSGKGTQGRCSLRRRFGLAHIEFWSHFPRTLWAVEPNSAKRLRKLWIAASSSLHSITIPMVLETPEDQRD